METAIIQSGVYWIYLPNVSCSSKQTRKFDFVMCYDAGASSSCFAARDGSLMQGRFFESPETLYMCCRSRLV